MPVGMVPHTKGGSRAVLSGSELTLVLGSDSIEQEAVKAFLSEDVQLHLLYKDDIIIFLVKIPRCTPDWVALPFHAGLNQETFHLPPLGDPAEGYLCTLVLYDASREAVKELREIALRYSFSSRLREMVRKQQSAPADPPICQKAFDQVLARTSAKSLASQAEDRYLYRQVTQTSIWDLLNKPPNDPSIIVMVDAPTMVNGATRASKTQMAETLQRLDRERKNTPPTGKASKGRGRPKKELIP